MSKTQPITPKEFFIQKYESEYEESPCFDIMSSYEPKVPAIFAVKCIEEYAQLFTKKTKPKKGKLTPKQEAELEANISLYNEIFPKIKIPTSGLPARSTPRELKNSFIWFLLENPQYTWDIILKATNIYVKEFEMKQWEFMRTSQYFVRKQEKDKTWISTLERYCLMVVQGYTEEDQGFRGPSVKVV